MEANYFTILYWFCHTSTWIHHGCTRVPHPEPSSHLPPYTISLGHPSAPAPSILYSALSLDWQFITYMNLYMFQCHFPKSSHPLPLPEYKDCSIHLCLFCCLAYRVIVTIFLNSIPKTRNYKTPRGDHRLNTLWHKSQQDPLWPTSQNIGNKNKNKPMGPN